MGAVEAASRTALSTAVARGRHRLYDDQPWILDDPFALLLVGPEWREIEHRTAAVFPAPVTRAYLGSIVVRSRYCEDVLLAGGFGQFVVLGAGLDAFVWRRPDLARAITVFEVDHPASQAAKLHRAGELGLPLDHAVYVGADAEHDVLGERLTAHGLDWSVPTCFSLLGTAMYLRPSAVEAVLRTVARCTAGSTVVLSYVPTPEHLDETGRRFDELASLTVAAMGEPVRSRWSRAEIEALVGRAGLEVADHPDHADLVAAYFAHRGDGLRPCTAEGLLTATVGAEGRPRGSLSCREAPARS